MCVWLCPGEEEEEREAESRRRANSLTSLADPSCCYGNSLWQRGPQLDLVYTCLESRL